MMGLLLKSKLVASNITWNEQDSTFELSNLEIKKDISQRKIVFLRGNRLDTVFAFTPKDLIYKSALAQEMPSDELAYFYNLSKKRGVKELKRLLCRVSQKNQFAYCVLYFNNYCSST